MRFLLCLIVVSTLFLTGCGEQLPPGMPKPYPVTIQVVSEGKPVEGVSVLFFPEDRTSRWGSGGTTDSAGNVSIKTLGKYNGAPPGKYAMSISKIEMVLKPGGNPDNPVYDYYDLVAPKFNNMVEPAIWVDVVKGKNVFVQEVGPLVRIKQK